MNLRFIITAGPTREHIDPVRFISNPSSGRMGFAVAAAAARRGHNVVLVAGPVSLPTPKNVRRIDIVSARDMLAAVQSELAAGAPGAPTFFVATAAVADWRPKETAAQKLVDGVDIRDPEDPDAQEEIAFATDVYLENGFAELVLIEGKNREIRRMMRAVGYEIRDLKRVSYCKLQLGDLPAGEFRELTADEMNKLRQAVHL